MCNRAFWRSLCCCFFPFKPISCGKLKTPWHLLSTYHMISTNTLMLFSNWIWKGKVGKSFLFQNQHVSLSAALPSRFLTGSRVSHYPCYWHFRPRDSCVVGRLVHGKTFRNTSHLCWLSTDRSQLKTTPDTSKCLIRGRVISESNWYYIQVCQPSSWHCSQESLQTYAPSSSLTKLLLSLHAVKGEESILFKLHSPGVVGRVPPCCETTISWELVLWEIPQHSATS